MQYGVYIHAKPTGEPFYVGKGAPSRSRSLSFAARSHNPHYCNIIKKYGKENIIIDYVLCESEAAAFALEIEWIATLRKLGAKLANLTIGGEGASGFRQSEETKEKHRKNSRGNSYALGYKHTEDAKRRMSESRNGHVISEETRRKIGEANRLAALLPETKVNLSAAAKKRGVPRETIEKMLAGRARVGATKESEAKRLASRAGYRHSEETKAKIRATRLQTEQEKKNGLR